MYHLDTDHQDRKVCLTVSRMSLLKPWASLRGKSGTLQHWCSNSKKGCLCWHCLCLLNAVLDVLFPPPILAVLLSAAQGGCTLNVLAPIGQIMPNVLLVLGLGFLRSRIVSTENQDRSVVSLRQGRQLDVVSKITCRTEKGRSSPCVCSRSRSMCSPCRLCCRGGRVPRHPPCCAWGPRAQHNLQMHYTLSLKALQGCLSCFAPGLLDVLRD